MFLFFNIIDDSGSILEETTTIHKQRSVSFDDLTPHEENDDSHSHNSGLGSPRFEPPLSPRPFSFSLDHNPFPSSPPGSQHAVGTITTDPIDTLLEGLGVISDRATNKPTSDWRDTPLTVHTAEVDKQRALTRMRSQVIIYTYVYIYIFICIYVYIYMYIDI
jgi:hypothetical protein